MRIVFLGLSITSSWGNGHATTYRSLVNALKQRGHDVLFLERDVPWYAENRDLPGAAELYGSLDELRDRFSREVGQADLVVVGSYVPEGVAVGEWVLRTARGLTAFYDIDTPVTLAKLAQGDYEYLTPEIAGRYDLYLSFTGGPTLARIRALYGVRCPRALYCSVDPALYYPDPHTQRWDVGYLGTYSDDRQPALDRLLVQPARAMPERKFTVAGPQYPVEIEWPENVERIEHLPPSEHRCFYNSQRFTLNVTRREMVLAGWSPSVRLFEAAACGVPIVSDYWPGLEEFFRPGSEILIGETEQAIAMSENQRLAMAERARATVLARHTAANRAAELESYIRSLYEQNSSHSARANGYSRLAANGALGGRAPEQRGSSSGGAVSAATGGNEDHRDLQQPARTRNGDGKGNRRGTPDSVTDIGSYSRAGVRSLDGTNHQ